MDRKLKSRVVVSTFVGVCALALTMTAGTLGHRGMLDPNGVSSSASHRASVDPNGFTQTSGHRATVDPDGRS